MVKQHTSKEQIKIVDTKHTCKVCDIRRVLLKTCREGEQLPETVSACLCQGPYLPGDYIYHSGDPADYVYAVTSGTVKCEIPTYNGELYVTGFYLQGELFGADALGEQRHLDNAIVVERSWICALPVKVLEQTCYGHPEALRNLFQLTTARARHAVTHLFSSRCINVDQRVLNFLYDLETRTRRQRNWASNEIPLTMNKEDIANYLAITPETLSRCLRRLHEAGIIQNGRKSFTLLQTPDMKKPIIA